MLVYSVSWTAHEDLTNGKGRVKKNEFMFHFTVLCRNITDASLCLDYLFPRQYKGKFDLCDGEVSFKRYKIDSRNFTVQYLLMDGMTRPLYLHDCKSALSSYFTGINQLDVYDKRLFGS